MIKFVRFLILLQLTFLPLLPATNQYGYEQIKILFFIFSTSLIGLIWVNLLIQKKITIHWSLVKLLSFTFIIFLLLASLTGLDPVNSVVGHSPYFQGWVFYSYLFLFSLIVSSIGVNLKEFTAVFLVSSLIVSAIAIKQYIEVNIFHINLPTYAGRVVSTFGQPNFYAGFLLIILPFITSFFEKNKKLVIATILFSVIAILISQSRISILILAIYLLILWILNLGRQRKILLVIGAILVTVISLTLFKVDQNLYIPEVINPTSQQWLINNSPEKRIVIWPVLIEQATKNLYFGYGLENINPAFEGYIKFHEQRSPAYYGIKNLIVDRSHNYLLDLLIFSGVIGLITWILLVARVIFLSRKNYLLISSLLVYLTWIQFQNQSVVHLVYFWILVGLIDQGVVDS